MTLRGRKQLDKTSSDPVRCGCSAIDDVDGGGDDGRGVATTRHDAAHTRNRTNDEDDAAASLEVPTL